MKKVPTLFIRDGRNPRIVLSIYRPYTEWVCRGEGRATRKMDGTSCMVRGGRIYRRRTRRYGDDWPGGFEPVDDAGSKVFGWVPVGDGPEDADHREAFSRQIGLPDGTYELMGPKWQGNPEGYGEPTLEPHGWRSLSNVPTDYTPLFEYLRPLDIEGVVWHHPDGRMVKIKKADFGLPREVLV